MRALYSCHRKPPTPGAPVSTPPGPEGTAEVHASIHFSCERDGFNADVTSVVYSDQFRVRVDGDVVFQDVAVGPVKVPLEAPVALLHDQQGADRELQVELSQGERVEEVEQPSAGEVVHRGRVRIGEGARVLRERRLSGLGWSLRPPLGNRRRSPGARELLTPELRAHDEPLEGGDQESRYRTTHVKESFAPMERPIPERSVYKKFGREGQKL